MSTLLSTQRKGTIIPPNNTTTTFWSKMKIQNKDGEDCEFLSSEPHGSYTILGRPPEPPSIAM